MHHPMDYVNDPWMRMVLRGRLVAPWRRRRFGAFGRNSMIHKPLGIIGPWKMEVGDDVHVFHGAWLATERSSWEKPGPALVLGDGVTMGRHVTIVASESVVIEPGAGIASFTTITDNDHTLEPGRHILDTPLISRPVRIGEGAWVAERVAITAGAQIGRYCVIGANSVVRGEIPDYSVAVGAPARVVKQLRPDEIRA